MKRLRSLWLLVILLGTVVMPVHADGGIYVVRPGDTMLAIAARNGLTATQLASANGLAWNAWVYVGQRLTIPGAGQPAASPVAAAGGTYVVRARHTLTGIAARHGVSVTGIAATNGMSANAWVYVGQRLKIPGAGSTAPAGSSQPPAPAGTAGSYVVRPGDTLIGIAARHRLTVIQLAQANGMYSSSWVYVGQQLKIPAGGQTSGQPATQPTTSTGGGTYVVRPGDTLIGIAARHGVGVSRLAAVNGLNSGAWVYVGQRLQIPGAANAGTTTTGTTTTTTGSSTGKWIDVDLSTQTINAYEGNQAVHTSRVSTGTWQTPTVAGTYSIYAKYASSAMSGPGYYLPNVPYAMYFYRGYALHGTYWHNNFGTPMSHGCVNLPTPSAKWIFEWAPIGTRVVTHY